MSLPGGRQTREDVLITEVDESLYSLPTLFVSLHRPTRTYGGGLRLQWLDDKYYLDSGMYWTIHFKSRGHRGSVYRTSVV